jgi:hypothetical protein
MLKIRWVPSRGYITHGYQNCPVCSTGASHSHITIYYYPLPPQQLEHERSECHLGLKKLRFSGPTPSNGPSNGFALIKIIKS